MTDNQYDQEMALLEKALCENHITYVEFVRYVKELNEEYYENSNRF